MPFKPVEHPKCPKCGKSVYAAEEMVAGGYKWHKFCFKCTMCNKLLDSMSCCEHQAELFCRGCHCRRFGPKGIGFGIGAGALTMDTGEQFGNKEVEMTCVLHGLLCPFSSALFFCPCCPVPVLAFSSQPSLQMTATSFSTPTRWPSTVKNSTASRTTVVVTVLEVSSSLFLSLSCRRRLRTRCRLSDGGHGGRQAEEVKSMNRPMTAEAFTAPINPQHH